MSVLCLVISVILIPINVFAVNFAEWAPMLMGIASIIGLVFYFMIFKTKLVIKIVLPIVFSVIVIVSSAFAYMFPYWNSYTFKEYNAAVLNYDDVITYREAREDIDEAVRYLVKTHPMFIDGLTEEICQIHKEVLSELKDKDKISVNDMRRAIQRIVNPMRDAHTTTYNSYPNDKYLKDAPKKNYEKCKIVSVNGNDVNSIIENAKQYYSYESEDWINVDLGSLASLDFYGFSAPYTYVWRDHEGRSISETYSESDFVPYSEYENIVNEYFPHSDAEEKESFVYYEIDDTRSLAVLTLTSCICDDEYQSVVNDMFTEIKLKNIKNVAVDVRGNGGGNSMVADEFIRYLPVDTYIGMPCDIRLGSIMLKNDALNIKNRRYKDLTFSGDLYVLTDRSSFSAAKDFAMLIQDNKLGKIIGEPPANAVNGYGDVVGFCLKNTGMYMQISHKQWYRTDSSNKDEYVMPDYPSKGQDAYDTLYGILTNNS